MTVEGDELDYDSSVISGLLFIKKKVQSMSLNLHEWYIQSISEYIPLSLPKENSYTLCMVNLHQI